MALMTPRGALRNLLMPPGVVPLAQIKALGARRATRPFCLDARVRFADERRSTRRRRRRARPAIRLRLAISAKDGGGRVVRGLKQAKNAGARLSVGAGHGAMTNKVSLSLQARGKPMVLMGTLSKRQRGRCLNVELAVAYPLARTKRRFIGLLDGVRLSVVLATGKLQIKETASKGAPKGGEYPLAVSVNEDGQLDITSTLLGKLAYVDRSHGRFHFFVVRPQKGAHSASRPATRPASRATIALQLSGKTISWSQGVPAAVASRIRKRGRTRWKVFWLQSPSSTPLLIGEANLRHQSDPRSRTPDPKGR
jgi:hypothetical protein